tara:strand:+ start:7084 stop:7830 length:747 start_codon:yes stop_codon:yes gene_type:complete
MKFFKNYFNLVKKSKDTFVNINILKFPIHNILWRYLSFFLTPLFTIIGLSANQATYIRILVGICSIFLIFSGKIILGIFFYFIGDIIDCVDGNIARVKNSATYYGKFLDGWVDIVIENLLIFSLAYYYLKNLNLNDIEIIFFIITIIINLSFNFLLDRYHNFRRWANEDKNNIDYMSILSSGNLVINNILNDCRYLSLLLIIYDNFDKSFMILFLSVSILYSLHKTILVLLISSKTLNLKRKSLHARK